MMTMSGTLVELANARKCQAAATTKSTRSRSKSKENYKKKLKEEEKAGERDS